MRKGRSESRQQRTNAAQQTTATLGRDGNWPERPIHFIAPFASLRCISAAAPAGISSALSHGVIVAEMTILAGVPGRVPLLDNPSRYPQVHVWFIYSV